MSLKPFCNKCLKVQIKYLLVTSCRHVICTHCFPRNSTRCGVCNAPCKALHFSQLPEEMKVYFKPVIPSLKKLVKITQFQLQQRSLWTSRRRHVLVRRHRKKDKVKKIKESLLQFRQEYKAAVRANCQLKLHMKKKRRAEPKNPFEMNSNRNLSEDDDMERIRSQTHTYGNNRGLNQTPVSFNSSTRSSLSSRSNTSTVFGYSPMLNATPRRMSSTANTSAFFNGSSISASSSLNSSTASSRTGQLRRLLEVSSIRSTSPPQSERAPSRNYRCRRPASRHP